MTNGWVKYILTMVKNATGFSISGGTSSKTLTVSGDAEIGQAWTTPAFDAGNFTGNGSMTWTVAAGDVATYAYIINGKTMTVAFALNTTTVGGTPNTDLQIAIPASKTATKTMRNKIFALDNNVVADGMVTATAAATILAIRRFDSSNWAASTDATYIYGEITFEIN